MIDSIFTKMVKEMVIKIKNRGKRGSILEAVQRTPEVILAKVLSSAALGLLTALLISCGPASGGGGGGDTSPSTPSLSSVGVTNVIVELDATDPTIIRVSWDTPSDPNSNITDYRVIATVVNSAGIEEVNQERIMDVLAMPGMTQTAEFTNLLGNHSYRFRIVVLNADGDTIAQSRAEDTAFTTPVVIPEDADGDGDGIADIMDNCPRVPNPNQENTYGTDDEGDACGDNDDDGLVDIMDNCPLIANPNQENLDGDTNGGDACDDDDDNDGVADVMDNCPLIANPLQTNTDGDTNGDACDNDGDNDGVNDFAADGITVLDVDRDGDGLIELYNVLQLNMTRNNLGGTSLDSNYQGDPTQDDNGNSMGCPATGCNGYELMADVDLNDLEPDISKPNWESLGNCGSNCATPADTLSFGGTFEGNNHTISSMRIVIGSAVHGNGFFGSIGAGSVVRNLHIRGGNINISPGPSFSTGSWGGLVGHAASGSLIVNSSVVLDFIRPQRNAIFVGGLVGNVFSGTQILSCYAVIGSIVISQSGATGAQGGLVGIAGGNVVISSSAAIVGDFIEETSAGTFADETGGLVGAIISTGTSISSSYAIVGRMPVNTAGGGLVGSTVSGIRIDASYAATGTLFGFQNLGGLVGNIPISAGTLNVQDSYSVLQRFVNGTTNAVEVDEFIGSISAFNMQPMVVDSYWQNATQDLLSNFTLMGANADRGEGRSADDLRMPTDFTTGGADNPYANWGDNWCNPETGQSMESTTDPDGSDGAFRQAWDLGGSDDYPVINCFDETNPNFLTPALQREAIQAIIDERDPASVISQILLAE